MVKASKSAVCIFVDCQWGAKHEDLARKYKVRGFPTLVYADSDGEEVGRMTDCSPEAVARDFSQLASAQPSRSR